MSTGNMIYPLIIYSFKQLYTNLSSQFFRNPDIATTVFGFHKNMVRAIEEQDEDMSIKIMKEMLDHGESHLKKMISTKK